MARIILASLVGLAISLAAVAGEREEKQIREELVRAFPDLKSANIKPSPVSGIYEVEFDSKIFYSTGDGKYLFMGDMVDLRAQNNLTEARRAAIRARLLNDVGEGNMIVIGPDKPRRTVTVFTDVDCGYCARFHLDVSALNKAGVKVRYLFYPGAGAGSESYKRAVAVWCAKDRVTAIGAAKAGERLEMKTCANPVDSHMQLGQRLEIGGTPAIFLDDGKALPGYVPAPRLLAILGLRS